MASRLPALLALACARLAAGGKYTDYSAGMAVEPGVAYRGLDFSYRSFKKIAPIFPTPIADDPDNPLFGTRQGVAWACAKACNDHPKCKTYTAHTHRVLLTAFSGECFLHEHWHCDGADSIVKDSIGHDIFSAVCRQETEPC